VWIPLIIIAIALYPVRLGFYEMAYPWIGADAIWWSFVAGAFAGLALAWVYYHHWNWRGRAAHAALTPAGTGDIGEARQA
jgi:Na+-driven multidrug efflux pump